MYTYTQFIMLQQQKFLTFSDQILGLFRIIKSEITGGKKSALTSNLLPNHLSLAESKHTQHVMKQSEHKTQK